MEKTVIDQSTSAGFRLVRMESCRVAAAHGFGSQPEGIAMDKLIGWMKKRGLPIEKARLLGFNNPSPSPASANYGYEQWVVLEGKAGAAAEAATGADEGIEFVDFPGGLYAVAEHRGRPENLPASWGAFSMAVERSAYRRSSRQWLEEILTPELLAGGQPIDWDAFGFDLFIAVEEAGS